VPADIGGPGALRVSLDVSAVPVDPVGAGRYTVELARELATRTEVELVVVARRDDASRWRTVAPGTRLAAVAPGRRPVRLAWEQVGLPAVLRHQGVTVHHGPHYTMPERSKLPAVVTVHDLSFFEAPEWHERSKVMLFRRAIRVAARRARVVICPSQATADELARWCRVEVPVVVAHHGVDVARFRPIQPTPDVDASALVAVDGRLTGERPYLVFVGTLEPRKDVPTLVRAFSSIATAHPDALLVLAGGAGWGAAQVELAVSASGVGDRVVRTGYVPDATIPALLRGARAAVYPALYEGFGLPALEALACGTPLITTTGSAMEEVAGDAASLVAPGDTAALADALDLVLAGPAGDAGARQRGLEIAARHTWAASADRHLHAYRVAAGR